MRPHEPPNHDTPAPPSGRTVFARPAPRECDVRGVRMRWDECGEGIPVVLVHGIPTSPRLWRHVMTRVAGARLLAWEMVGYGESIPEGRDRDISVRAQAGHLLDWLDEMRIERAVLAGHDLGGGVVQIAALRAPERCAGLLLTNAIGYDSWPIPSVKLLRASGALVRHMPDAAVKAGVFRMLMARGHDDGEIADESLDLHFAPYARHGAGEALIRQIDALDVRDTLDVADRLPTLANIPARGLGHGRPLPEARARRALRARPRRRVRARRRRQALHARRPSRPHCGRARIAPRRSHRAQRTHALSALSARAARASRTDSPARSERRPRAAHRPPPPFPPLRRRP